MAGSLAKVASFTSPWEAQVLKARLEAEGIPTFLTNEHLISGAWMYSQAVGGVEVLVPSTAKDEAATILEAILNGKLAESSENTEGQCPQCGQPSANEPPRSLLQKGLASAVLLLTGSIFPPAREPANCPHCGHRWHGDEATI